MKKGPLELYGVSIAIIPKKDDPSIFTLYCTPISVTEKQNEGFNEFKDLNITETLNMGDIKQATQIFTKVVRLIKHMEVLQRQNCENHEIDYRPLSIYAGEDSRRPVKMDVFAMYFAGAAVNRSNIYQYVIDNHHEQPLLDEFSNRNKVLALGYLEGAFATLGTDQEKQAVCDALNDIIAPAISYLKKHPDFPSTPGLLRVMDRELKPEDLTKPDVLRQLANFMVHPKSNEFPGMDEFIIKLKEQAKLPDEHPIKTYSYSQAAPKKFVDLSTEQKRVVIDHAIELFTDESVGFDEFMPIGLFGAMAAAGINNEPFIAARDNFLYRHQYNLYKNASPGFIDSCKELAKLLKEVLVTPGSYNPGSPKVPAEIMTPSKMDLEIAELKKQWDNATDFEPHRALEDKARQLGELYANHVNKRFTTFWFVSPIEGYENNKEAQEKFPSYALTSWHPDFRKAFNEGFQDNMFHILNRSLKQPLDPSNRFFADPLADKIRDELDVALGRRMVYLMRGMPKTREKVLQHLNNFLLAAQCFEEYKADLESDRIRPEDIGKAVKENPKDPTLQIEAILVERITGRTPTLKGRIPS